MEKRKGKKILVAVDGSHNAMEAVRYVSRVAASHEMEVVLFNVHSRTPEYYWDLEMQLPSDQQMLQEIRKSEIQQESAVKEFLEKAKLIFLDAGFAGEVLTAKIHERETGVARDIVEETHSGYSAVVVGRKGMTRMEDLVLGSISTKLLETLNFVPVLLVGENPQIGKTLVAIDGSEGAMGAVDFVGETLGGSNFKVLLIHVIRGDETEYVARAQVRIRDALGEARNRLVGCGFQEDDISTKIVTGALSRAGVIVHEAKQGGYGTIVVGRRGLSKVQEFFMGRVCNKVIQLAKQHTVWVVS